MRQYIVDSMKNFFHETLETACEEYEKFPAQKVYSAVISLENDVTCYHFSLCMQEETLVHISTVLLYEDNPDVESKMDLISECANLIIGSAKVAIEEYDPQVSWQLSPPEYQGYFEEEFSKEFDEKYYFTVQDTPIMIGMESVEIRALV